MCGVCVCGVVCVCVCVWCGVIVTVLAATMGNGVGLRKECILCIDFKVIRTELFKFPMQTIRRTRILNPMNTICSRGDLLKKPEGGGCYDIKVSETINCTCFDYCFYDVVNVVLLLVCVIMNNYCSSLTLFQITDYSMALAMTAVAESGPTHQVCIALWITHSLLM